MLIDSHTHLANYNLNEIPEIINRAQNSGISIIITAGSDIENSEKCIDIANNNYSVYCGVGIHPNKVTKQINDDYFTKLELLANSNEKIITISETGMDYLPSSPDINIQENAFVAQIEIAKKIKLPLIWHSQISEINKFEKHKITIDILNREHAYSIGGIMHYFQADYETATKAIDSGFLVSFAKPLLRQKHQIEIVEKIPLEHIVLETDASPQPWKGDRSSWTEPKDTLLVAKKIAEIKKISIEDVMEQTTTNLNKLFNGRLISTTNI